MTAQLNHRYIFLAHGELYDFFSRLGGSARPDNMLETDIPIYLLSKLLSFNEIDIDLSLNLEFNKSCEPIEAQIEKRLQKINCDETELLKLAREFYEYYDMKRSENVKHTGGTHEI